MRGTQLAEGGLRGERQHPGRGMRVAGEPFYTSAPHFLGFPRKGSVARIAAPQHTVLPAAPTLLPAVSGLLSNVAPCPGRLEGPEDQLHQAGESHTGRSGEAGVGSPGSLSHPGGAVAEASRRRPTLAWRWCQAASEAGLRGSCFGLSRNLHFPCTWGARPIRGHTD